MANKEEQATVQPVSGKNRPLLIAGSIAGGFLVLGMTFTAGVFTGHSLGNERDGFAFKSQTGNFGDPRGGLPNGGPQQDDFDNDTHNRPGGMQAPTDQDASDDSSTGGQFQTPTP